MHCPLLATHDALHFVSRCLNPSDPPACPTTPSVRPRLPPNNRPPPRPRVSPPPSACPPPPAQPTCSTPPAAPRPTTPTTAPRPTRQPQAAATPPLARPSASAL